MYVDVLEFRVEEMSMGLAHLLAGLARSSADALFAMTHPAIVLDIQPKCAAAKKDRRHMPRWWRERYAEINSKVINSKFEEHELEISPI